VGNNNISQIIFDQEKWILSRFNQIIHGTTATGDVSESEQIRIYPNPASDFIDVANAEFIDEVEFVGVAGISLSKVIHNGRVEISDLPAGYYNVILRDRANDIVYRRAIIIL